MEWVLRDPSAGARVELQRTVGAHVGARRETRTVAADAEAVTAALLADAAGAGAADSDAAGAVDGDGQVWVAVDVQGADVVVSVRDPLPAADGARGRGEGRRRALGVPAVRDVKEHPVRGGTIVTARLRAGRPGRTPASR